MSTLLVVENDEGTALALRILLSQSGYHVEHTRDGRAALRAARAVQPELLVFDLGLSSVDRSQALAAIRELRDVPVLLLAPPGQDADEVRVLRQEAAGYLAKPFDNADLVSKIEELLHRPKTPAQRVPATPFDPVAAAQATTESTAAGTDTGTIYDDGYLRLDAQARSARVDGREIRLTPIEFRLLEVLIRNHDTVLSPNQLLARAWGDPSGVGPDRVKFAVLRLRRKLGAREPEESPVESVRGFGYRYCQPGQR